MKMQIRLWVLVGISLLAQFAVCAPKDGLTDDQKKRLVEVLDDIGAAYEMTFEQAVDVFAKSKSGAEWQLRDLELQAELIKTTITNRVITEKDKEDAVSIMSRYGILVDHELAKAELPKHTGPFYDLWRRKILSDDEAKRLWQAYTNRTQIREFILKDEPVTKQKTQNEPAAGPDSPARPDRSRGEDGK